MNTEKKRFGDRRDGRLIRDIDAMHYVMPLIYPGRCDNEAYISEKIDLTAIKAWLEKQNALPENKDFRITVFHVLTTCMAKTIHLRPKMNRFIANKNIYQRDKVTLSFVVKKYFGDESAEGLAILEAAENDTFFTLFDKLKAQIIFNKRQDVKDTSSNAMDVFKKMPRFLSRFLIWCACRLDVHGWLPDSLIGTDPYYTTVLFSNVGSIGLGCGYHHLTNWGTNSVFCLIGKMDENSVRIGLTIDERLADGYYYSKTIKLFKFLTEHPELLEQEFIKGVDYE